MSKEIQNSRSAGIDLCKALSMYLVVVLHVLGHGGILSDAPMNSGAYYAGWFLETAATCAVNCFGMATGYLMVGKNLRYRKMIPLWLTVFFYTVVIFGLGMVFLPGSVTGQDIITILPVTSNKYWYFTAYFLLFFFIPCLNLLIEKLPKRHFLGVLLGGFVLLSVTSVVTTGNDCFKLDRGNTAWWLMYLYLLGAGIKKYDLFSGITAGKALLGCLVMVVISWGIKLLSDFLIAAQIPGISGLVYTYGNLRFLTFIAPTMLASGVFLLIACLRVKVPEGAGKVLKWMSPMVFQVYIIHTHQYVWRQLLLKRFLWMLDLSLPVLILAVLGVSAAIFAGCILIDWVRVWLFRLLKVDKLADVLAEKGNRLLNRIVKF